MDSPLMGVGDVMSGGTDPADNRDIDHTPKAVAAIAVGCILFIYVFNRSGLRVVIGIGGAQ
jgi:hypothetical protein